METALTKDLNEAANRLGRGKGGDALGKDLAQLGGKAQQVKGKIAEVERETDKLRSAFGRVDNGAFEGLKTDAAGARSAISGIGVEARELRRALGSVDDNGLRGLKGDAAAAEQAIRQIGQAADAAEQKLRGLHITGGRGGSATSGRMPVGRMGSGFVNAAEGAVDQFGLPIALGAGTAYLAGAVPAGAGIVAGAAVNAAANDEERAAYLQVAGGYSDEQRRRYAAMMDSVGRRRGIGTSGSQEIFAALQAGGLSSEDAAAMMDNVAIFTKATQGNLADAANTTVALRDNMGITANQMPAAYDAIALGAKAGRFEPKDMARNLPSILALSNARGSSGLEGVRLAAAIAQSVVKRKASPDEAATSIEAMLSDINSASTIDRAKKLGVDLDDVSAEAITAGKDPLLEQLRALRSIGLDPKKSREVFTNQTATEGYSAVFQDFDVILSLMKEMRNAEGTVSKDYDGAENNLNSQKSRLFSNFAANFKDMADPILPALTAGARGWSERMEGAAEAQRQQEEKIKAHFAKQRLAHHYQMYGQSRAEGERGAPSALQHFIFGRGAEKDFNLREHMGVDLRSTAQDSMQGYNDALTTEGAKAQGIASSIAENIKAMFGFTVSPTIQPTYIQPTGSGTGAVEGQKHTSINPTSNRFNQTIISPNSMHAARQVRREIQKAQARMEDDKYGVYKPMFSEMGRKSKQHPDEMIFGLLAAGFTTVCYDGQNFFDQDHSHIDPQFTDQPGSVANMQVGSGPAWFLLDLSKAMKPIIWQERIGYEFQTVTEPKDTEVFMTDEFLYGIRARVNAGFGLWQLAFGSKAELNKANYAAARQAMAGFSGDRGHKLGITPTHLVVPSTLEGAARELLLSDQIEGSSNIWKGTADLIVTPWLG